MRLESVSVVAKREYLQRIKGKGFWIATLVLPLFLVAMAVLPSLLLSRSEAKQRVVVVDATGKVASELRNEPPKPESKGRKGGGLRNASFEMLVEPPGHDPAAQQADLNRRVLAGKIDAWIWIDEAKLKANSVEYHAKSVSNFLTQEVLKNDLSAAIRRVRLREAGLDPERISQLTQPIDLETLRVSKEGSRAEGGLAGAAFAYILFMLLYVTLAIWGQQVMTGVLDEKSSRVVEVVISTIRPFDLMMGKLTGICLLGLTQIGIWLTTLFVLSAPGLLAAFVALPEGVHLPTLTVEMAIHFLILFTLGFFVFATFYAAIGASFNNLQEAQQVAGFVVFFLVIPVFLMFRIINDPDSKLAVVASLIPPFTPLLMTLRIALQMPPLWQILLAYALTLAFIWLMVWLCARVYRIGILMYGKKPTFQEIWKWMRYA
ncbi:MAG TPA: ABC transporter permease [Thermoanaerobaculia bacterium]|nr:ABC transporter permease [Thermoanaerobaculia bacterium]